MSSNAAPVTRTLYAAQCHDETVATARHAGRVEVNDRADQLKVTPETTTALNAAGMEVIRA